jgi:hypothetical protein
LPTWAKIGIGVIGTVASGGLATAVGLGLGGYGLIAGSTNKTEQIKQQYHIAVLKFYIDDLSNFLGENK